MPPAGTSRREYTGANPRIPFGRGPPSTIRPDEPLPAVPAVRRVIQLVPPPAPRVLPSSSASSATTIDLTTPPRLRRARPGTRARLAAASAAAAPGFRLARSVPLTDDDLYIDDTRPPILATPKPHHICSICFSIKSHPVSHCFVCIRVWLEKQWLCPDCGQDMHMAPFRHYGEEMGIAYDYPFWCDDSRVSYSFEGLVFPQPPASVISLCSP
ncbi:hypothetical protein DFH08DRAFT_972260 [Mycena albidolilacea]|uniref:Uncharacterized protein n=1 Tax=Mycena albidolilacea TaxID=1033008 RepID=A0AAD7EEV0_9AGAR|nr:hypothetical protein DFH08DRAFT_972260 [Mycena albidolilacea]